MAESWTADRFPHFEASLRRLTDQHRELADEPLHLAISYSPATRDQQDVFLFEVVGGLAEGINPERDLFEATYLSASGFPMKPNEQLHLILTNPRELEIGLEEGWPLVREIVLRNSCWGLSGLVFRRNWATTADDTANRGPRPGARPWMSLLPG